MKLTFELTLTDHLTFNDYIQRTKGKKIRIYIILGLFVAYLIYFLYGEVQRGLDWATFVILGFYGAVFYYLTKLMLYPGRTVIKKAVKQNPSLTGHRTIEIIDNTLTYSSSTSTSTYHFDAFIDLEEVSEYLYLFTDKTSAIILPKRAFPTNKEIEQLKQWVSVKSK